MAKGTPFTEQDLIARGFRNNGSGVYVFIGERPFNLNDHLGAGNGPPRTNARQVIAIDAKDVAKKRPTGLVAIENVLRAAGIPFVNEHVFSDKNRYRFDVAVPSMMLAVEYEGIFSKDQSKNGHTGVTHYIKDCNKYNLAVVEGWKILRYTAKNYKNFITDLQQLLTQPK